MLMLSLPGSALLFAALAAVAAVLCRHQDEDRPSVVTSSLLPCRAIPGIDGPTDPGWPARVDLAEVLQQGTLQGGRRGL
jgi:hypothetical protein